MDNLLDEFIIEAQELLDEIESELLNFDPASPLPKSTYSHIFRNFHSLKGSSGMMGLDELQRHTHLLEDKFQSYETKLGEIHTHIDYFLTGVDVARDLLHGRKVDYDFSQEVKPKSGKLKTGIYTDKLVINDSEIPIFSFIGFEERVTTAFFSNFQCYYYKDLTLFNINSKKIRNTIIIIKSTLNKEFKNQIDTTRNEIFPTDDLSSNTLSDNLLLLLVNNVSVKENLNKAILLLMYQQSDLEAFLLKNKKLDILNNIKVQIREILTFRNTLRLGSKE